MTAAEVAAAAEAFLSTVSRFAPADASAEDCVLVTAAAARVEKAASGLRVLVAARAVACGAHKRAGVADPSRWVARQAGTTNRQAKEALAAAASIGEHPATKAALLSGQISLPQAQEITKVADELPGHEAALLAVARGADLTTLRDEVRERRLQATPVGDLHRRQLAARRFRHWRDGLGMVVFEGALPPQTGIPFVARIEREAARLHREAKRRGEPRRFEVYAADALVGLCSGGGADRKGAATDLVIVCDMYAWRRGHTHDAETCHLIGGGPVPVGAAKELAKDAFLKIVLHDGKDIQKVKHVGRRYTAELLTALDLGPAPSFSGRACAHCGQRGYGLQRDHAIPVASTGPTAIANLQDLCYRCHTEKTERDRLAGRLGKKAKARGPGPPRERQSRPTGYPGAGPP